MGLEHLTNGCNKNSTKIVLAATEIAYLPKDIDPAGVVKCPGGGLGVITASIFEEAWKQGLDAIIIIPEYYDMFRRSSNLSDSDFEDGLDHVATHPNVRFVDDGLFMHADRVYGDNSYALSSIDVRRAIHFTKGIIEKSRELNRYFPDSDKIYQLNEWTTALAAAPLGEFDKRKKTKVEMKFHNLGDGFSSIKRLSFLNKDGLNTQKFWKQLFYTNGFPSDDHGKDMYRLDVDFLTSGLHVANHISTVSPYFLGEVVSGKGFEWGVNIPGYTVDVVRRRNHFNQASGILNAPSRQADPAINPWIKHNYGTQDIMEGKKKNKLDFIKLMDLEASVEDPVILWPHRLQDPQKGTGLFIDTIDEALCRHPRLKIAFVADGDGNLINRVYEKQDRYKGRVSIKEFSRELSEQGKAGADFIIMPSKYEPSGLPQLEGPNFGTWPIVMGTGGLWAIHSFDEDKERGNGWIFKNHDREGILYGIGQAMEFYNQPYEFKEKHLQRAREQNLKEHNIENALAHSKGVWEYMIGKKLIPRE